MSQSRIIQRQVNPATETLAGPGSDVPLRLTMTHQNDLGHNEKIELFNLKVPIANLQRRRVSIQEEFQRLSGG